MSFGWGAFSMEDIFSRQAFAYERCFNCTSNGEMRCRILFVERRSGRFISDL